MNVLIGFLVIILDLTMSAKGLSDSKQFCELRSNFCAGIILNSRFCGSDDGLQVNFTPSVNKSEEHSDTR